jgi:hypothetical protein
MAESPADLSAFPAIAQSLVSKWLILSAFLSEKFLLTDSFSAFKLSFVSAMGILIAGARVATQAILDEHKQPQIGGKKNGRSGNNRKPSTGKFTRATIAGGFDESFAGNGEVSK